MKSKTVCCLLAVGLLAARGPASAAEPDEGRADLRELLRFTGEVWSRIAGESGGSFDLADAGAGLDRFGVTPEIGGVVSGSGLGIGFTHRAWRGPKAVVGWSALFTSKGYREVGLFHRRELGGSGRLVWKNRLRYRDLVQEDFFGLGLESAHEHRSDYGLSETSLASELEVRLSPTLRLDLGADVRRARTSAGTNDQLPAPDLLFAPEAIPGYGEAFHHAGFGLGLVRDTRDHPGYPRRGSLLDAELRQVLGLGERSPGYRSFRVEVQKAIPLPGHDHALVTRFRAEAFSAAGDGPLPFFLSRGLGGSHSLRSFPLNRFRGEDVVLGTVEYRFALLPRRLDGALFWDVGGAHEELGKLSLARLKHSFGAGIRILEKDDVLVRLEVAHGSEGAASS